MNFLLGQLTQKTERRICILHLLNYDHKIAAENVKIRLDLSGLIDFRQTKDLSQWELKVLSPDAPKPQSLSFFCMEASRSFTLRCIDHYTLLTLSVSPGQ